MPNIEYFHTHSPDFTAVFIADTPAYGHTGLSHLVEHMCFRGSASYPADHELFVINALLPVNVNATTYQGKTYFYATSKDVDTFTQVVRYLYAGLLQLDYSDAAISAERDGVLVNELRLLEKQPEYQRNLAVRLGDTSDKAYQHPGGVSSTISQITCDQVRAYKRQHYTANNIYALFSGPDKKLDKRITPIMSLSLGASLKQAALPPAPGYTVNNTSTGVGHLVSTWWLPMVYLSDIKQHENNIKTAMQLYGVFYIDEDANHQDRFALRFLHAEHDSAKGSITSKLTQLLLTLPIQAQPRLFNDPKLPCEVRFLIQQYHNEHTQNITCIEPLEVYLNKVYQSEYQPFRSQVFAKSGRSDKQPASYFADHHSDKISLSNLPPLPRLLTKPAMKANASSPFVQTGQNWIYLVDKSHYDRLHNAMLGADFWTPRTRGECYAMGVARLNNHVFIYAAEDMHTSMRARWCETNLMSELESHENVLI